MPENSQRNLYCFIFSILYLYGETGRANFGRIHFRRDMTIITKFTIATEQGVDLLLQLTKEIATQKFSSLLDTQTIESYIEAHFNWETLITDLNDLSNQFLVVYADDKPAGYARITSKGKRPPALAHKRCVRIADFGILQEYTEEAIRLSLLEKCIAISRSYEEIWIHEYNESPLISFFENKGFIQQTEHAELEEVPLPATYLVKQVS